MTTIDKSRCKGIINEGDLVLKSSAGFYYSAKAIGNLLARIAPLLSISISQIHRA